MAVDAKNRNVDEFRNNDLTLVYIILPNIWDQSMINIIYCTIDCLIFFMQEIKFNNFNYKFLYSNINITLLYIYIDTTKIIL